MIVMKLFMLFAALNVNAYEKLFQASSPTEVFEAKSDHRQQVLLREHCDFERLKQGFLWPCFLVPNRKWTGKSMNQHCRDKLSGVKSTNSLPSGTDLRRLTSVCQALVRERRRILDYKSNGT